jgi:hypothetical protein
MLQMAIKPEEHSRFTVEMGTWCGIPAAIAAAREMYRGDGGWQVPRVKVNGLPRQGTPEGPNTHTYTDIIDI